MKRRSFIIFLCLTVFLFSSFLFFTSSLMGIRIDMSFPLIASGFPWEKRSKPINEHLEIEEKYLLRVILSLWKCFFNLCTYKEIKMLKVIQLVFGILIEMNFKIVNVEINKSNIPFLIIIEIGGC